MENKDMVIVGLVVLLVLVVAFAGNMSSLTGNEFKRSCSDRDGGSSFVQGTISGTDTAGNSFEMTDYCSGENNHYLKEYSCSSDDLEGWRSDILYCESGCVDGACV